MKKTIGGLFVSVILIAASLQTHAQGFIYDQQATPNPPSAYGDYFDIQPAPLSQSFIPTFIAINFVQFQFWDIPNNGDNGATVYVNLWTGSPNIHSATLLGSTTPVYMPSGFGNGIAGITNFYFSALIGLIPGQTYYLQPVVLSGDNPWDIAVLTNTYSNGQLFANGYPLQPGSDLWFREGIVAPVPEPNVMSLIGLGCLFIYAFKMRSKMVVLFLAEVLLVLPVLPVHAAPDSVVQATADAAGLAPATSLPSNGTFWVMRPGSDGNLISSPYPFLPANLVALPIYSMTGDIFMVDDTGGQITSSTMPMTRAQTASIAQAQAQTVADLIGLIQNPSPSFQPNGFTPLSFDTNGLFLEASNEVTAFGLRLHNTIGGDNYQLLSTTNLSNTNWDLGEILLYAPDGYADFSPVPMTNALAFYRAHQASPVMQIYNAQDSLEPDPTNSDPGQPGIIYIQNESSATNDVTVYYRLSGTAQNGIDYSNLAEVATIPNGQSYVEIDIEPIADGLKPDQTVILTLLQNTNYLIDPAYYSATNTLYANPEVVPTAYGSIQQLCPNTQSSLQLNGYDPRGLPLTYTILT